MKKICFVGPRPFPVREKDGSPFSVSFSVHPFHATHHVMLSEAKHLASTANMPDPSPTPSEPPGGMQCIELTNIDGVAWASLLARVFIPPAKPRAIRIAPATWSDNFRRPGGTASPKAKPCLLRSMRKKRREKKSEEGKEGMGKTTARHGEGKKSFLYKKAPPAGRPDTSGVRILPSRGAVSPDPPP